jgi:uncharacterized membrane protein
MNTIFQKKNRPVILVYVLFGFGGLWHVLGLFQPLMRTLSAPLIMAATFYLMLDYTKNIPTDQRSRFIMRCLFVLCCGWGFELLGTRTGFPFGLYTYDPVLQPQIMDVPVAIGFAWLEICLCSLTAASCLIRKTASSKYGPWFLAVLSAACMVAFDLLMEQAAPVLFYWTWPGGIPLQNYASWFGIGFVFSAFFTHNRHWVSVFQKSSAGLHVFTAQAFYFMCVLITRLIPK